MNVENRSGFPNIKLVTDSLSKLGFKGGFVGVFEASQNAIETEVSRLSAKLLQKSSDRTALTPFGQLQRKCVIFSEGSGS